MKPIPCSVWFVTLAATLLSLSSARGAAPAAAETGALQPIHRDQLPEALRNVRLDHLSSGALLRLDRAGELVETPAGYALRLEQVSSVTQHQEQLVSLDPRVASNIRLGDDPPALPSNRLAQAEPHIVRSQADPDYLLAIFQEGRLTNGGAVDCGYSVSHD